MKPDIVVDVGNSRIKWGYCTSNEVLKSCSLPPDQPDEWTLQLEHWAVPDQRLSWVVSGVQPARRQRLVEWLRQRGDSCTIIDNYRQLMVQVMVDEPDRVGIDRLLNAVAALSRRHGRQLLLVVDAGTAVTVDAIDSDGVFRGGAILPGLTLMAKALHEHTALLPLVNRLTGRPTLPGTNTWQAITAGVFWAVAGGIDAVLQQLTADLEATQRQLFLTGGDAELLAPVLPDDAQCWPTMTLEGIRLTAETVPA